MWCYVVGRAMPAVKKIAVYEYEESSRTENCHAYITQNETHPKKHDKHITHTEAEGNLGSKHNQLRSSIFSFSGRDVHVKDHTAKMITNFPVLHSVHSICGYISWNNKKKGKTCHGSKHIMWAWHWKVHVSLFAIYIHSKEIHNVAALIVYWCIGFSSTCFGP